MHVLKNNLIFILSGLILLAGVGLWIQLAFYTVDDTKYTVDESNQADYFIENFVSRSHQESGESYIFQGDYLEFFPQPGIVRIKKPCLLISEDNNSAQVMYGDEGVVSQNGSVVILSGNVKVIEKLTEKAIKINFSPLFLSEICFSSENRNRFITSTDELTLQLEPRLKY